MTTKQTIFDWFMEGKRDGADYMLVVCDEFSHEDYPVYVGRDHWDADYNDPYAAIEHYTHKSMQRVLEVYDLHQSVEKQLALPMAWSV
jgi:hypothetical protein